MQDLLADLQSRLAFQEDAIQQLELFQAHLRGEMEQLRHMVRELALELRDLRLQLEPESAAHLAAERPPHY